MKQNEIKPMKMIFLTDIFVRGYLYKTTGSGEKIYYNHCSHFQLLRRPPHASSEEELFIHVLQSSPKF
jgi:hypothetical protein